MLRPSVLGLAILLSTPALWSAFAAGSMGITTALIRFLIAVPVAALMLALLRMVTAGYSRQALRRQLAAAVAARAEAHDQQAADRG
jgi:membrane protein implicated in regulation of membrane protease activity